MRVLWAVSEASKARDKGIDPPYCGHTLFSDVYYPVGRKHPFLLIACGLSRFCVSDPLREMGTGDISDGFAHLWFIYYGRRQVIIIDRGPGYVGAAWHRFCDVWGITHVAVATHASHSDGMVGRHVDLIKEVYRVSKRVTPTTPLESATHQVILARNMVPLQFANFDQLEHESELPLRAQQKNIRQLLTLRNHLPVREARRIISVCVNRRRRSFSQRAIEMGDFADAFSPVRIFGPADSLSQVYYRPNQ